MTVVVWHSTNVTTMMTSVPLIDLGRRLVREPKTGNIRFVYSKSILIKKAVFLRSGTT